MTKPIRGTWYEAVKRAERKRARRRLRRIVFALVAVVSILAAVILAATHRPGRRTRPTSSNATVRIVVALPSWSDAGHHYRAACLLSIQSEGGAQGKEPRTHLENTGSGRAGAGPLSKPLRNTRAAIEARRA